MYALLLPLFIVAQAIAAPPRISCDELRRLELTREPNLTIVDVRPPAGFAQSHIQGAQNVLASKIQTAGLPRSAHIVVYCSEAKCPLSSGAAQALIDDGYPRVELLDGGLGAWIERGYPLTTSKNTAGAPKPRRTLGRDASARVALGSVLPIDVRPAKEYAAGHLPNAFNAPLENLDALMPSVPKTKELLVYDRKPARARQAVAKLIAAGYNATELSGGLAGWKKGKQRLEAK